MLFASLFPFLLFFFCNYCTFAQEEDLCGDPGWIPIGERCYYFDMSYKSSVTDARSKCAQRKGRLPMFQDIIAYKKFNETVLVSYPNLSIPLGLQLVNDKWTWMNDGKTTNNVFWPTGAQAPHDDPLRKCVIRVDSGWRNVGCDDKSIKVTPVCQRNTVNLNISSIACAPLYRFGYGWQHLLTTNQASALERQFTKNQTNLMGETLFAATLHTPGVTQPLYEFLNPQGQAFLVNTDEDLRRLMRLTGYTLVGIVGYTLVSPDFAGTTMRHLSWSSDPPGDSVVSDEIEHSKYSITWGWKEKPKLYVFNASVGGEICLLERNCTLTEWSPWSNHSATCGNATRHRSREIVIPAAGNSVCPHLDEGEFVQLENCPTIIYSGISPEQYGLLDDHAILDSISDPQSLIASITNAVLPALFATHAGDNHEAGHQLNDTIEFCMYDDAKCDEEKLFTSRLNPFFGNCYTFNPREHELNVTRGGPQGGLRLLLRVQQHEYYYCQQTAGFKVYMHPFDEYPFVETYGYSIAPGHVTSMAISMAKLEKKSTPNNPCTDSWNDTAHPKISYYYNGTYTPEGCTKSCLQDYVIEWCKCADPRYARPSNVSFCVDDDFYGKDEKKKHKNTTSIRSLCPEFYQNSSCLGKTGVTDPIKLANCHCISQCNRTYFDAIINTAALLPNRHLKDVACNEANNTPGCEERAVYHFAMLEIYYERLQYAIFLEREANTVWGLLQDISNMLQNINGFDFFTVFEVGFLFAEIINVTFIGKRKKRKLKKSRLPLVRLLANDTTMVDFLFFLFTFCGSLMLCAFLYSSKILEIKW